MSLFDPEDNTFKLAIHGATLVLVAEMSAYNAIVYRRRGTAWHLFSSLVYASLVLLESVQVARHVGEP